MPRKPKPKPTDGFDARETYGRAILRYMAELGEPVLDADVAEEFKMHSSFARSKMNQLVAMEKVHIKKWVEVPRKNGDPYPRALYALGPGKNARKPKRKTATERQRETFRRAQALMAPLYPGIGQRAAYKLRAQINRTMKGETA